MEREPVADSPRPPEETDLVTLCRALNARGARYIVVGGMAVIQQGFLHATDEIEWMEIDDVPTSFRHGNVTPENETDRTRER